MHLLVEHKDAMNYFCTHVINRLNRPLYLRIYTYSKVEEIEMDSSGLLEIIRNKKFLKEIRYPYKVELETITEVLKHRKDGLHLRIKDFEKQLQSTSKYMLEVFP